MMLEVGGVAIPVEGESNADIDWSQPFSVDASIDNTPWGVRPQRPVMQWNLSWDVSRPDQYAMLLRLVYGEFGPGPFRLVDSTAAATNALSASVSMLEPFVDNDVPGVTVSGPVALDDGTLAGRHLLAAFATLTPGWNFTAMSPGAGKPVTVSSYAQSLTGVRIRPLWYTANPADPAVVGPTVTRAVAASGPLTRIHTTALVPSSITPSGGSPAPVARVGISVVDTVRIAAPAISWTDSMTEWGMGGSPRRVLLFPPSASTIQALREAGGLRASRVQVRAQEGGTK